MLTKGHHAKNFSISTLVVLSHCFMLVAPGSVLAANHGKLSTRSSVSSQVSVIILAKTQAQSRGQLGFDASKKQAIESGFCLSEWGTNLFRIKLAGSGINGNFQVSNQQEKPLAYQVAYKHQGKKFQSFKANHLSPVYSNTALKKGCKQAFSNQLKVAFPKTASLSKRPQNYHGVLTLTFSAE